MRILPILIEEAPDAVGWETLAGARRAAGYRERIQPARALPGSPQPILAIGTLPSWLTDYAYAPSLEPGSDLNEAMAYALDGESHDDVGEKYASLLSKWIGADVVYRVEEDFESGVQFS